VTGVQTCALPISASAVAAATLPTAGVSSAPLPLQPAPRARRDNDNNDFHNFITVLLAVLARAATRDAPKGGSLTPQLHMAPTMPTLCDRYVSKPLLTDSSGPDPRAARTGRRRSHTTREERGRVAPWSQLAA